ncbi:MAG: hypothetical protein CVU74_01550 [Deltaproteobacteria bacterium HGW-Deltaproteobacteria-9]|nr:MAG: hypothetical protein CVU74_01550 [Deltaproteobacteria bacterium HGW-Deltaproteobacteria-9]
MRDEEICLFHQDVLTGDDYFTILHHTITGGLSERKAVPIVRFADGEYAFYNYDLGCNGLYRQAETVDAIKKTMPSHITALKKMAASGKLAPLIFPGNSARKKKGGVKSFFSSKEESSASTFLKLLFHNKIELTADNYTPFYVVYAYLTSEDFIRLVDHKKICVISSEFNRNSCTNWFGRFSSTPDLSFVEIPAEYVATRWDSMKEGIIKQIPPDTELCLVGAGIGALSVCVDVAERLSIPAIDAGHVLNMMNDCVDKSNGSRLYTIRTTKN